MLLSSLQSDASSDPASAVRKALGEPSIRHFGALFAMPEVQALSSSDPSLLRALEVFCFGTTEDLPSTISLCPEARRKLAQLSLISYSTQSRQLGYAELVKRLSLSSVRELEDLVIDSIYAGVIKGKLDSQKQILEVDDWDARDVPSGVISEMVATLGAWLKSAEELQRGFLERADREDAQVAAAKEHATYVEKTIEDAKKSMEDSQFHRSDMAAALAASTASPEPPRGKRLRAFKGKPMNK